MKAIKRKTERLSLLHGLFIWPVFFYAAFAFLLYGAQPCLAETRIKPMLSARTTWDDSLFLKDFEAIEIRTEPALLADYKSERAKLNFGARLTDFRYFDTKDNYYRSGKKVDTNEYDRTTYKVDASISYELSERLMASLGAEWGQDYSVDSYWDDSLTEHFLLKRDSYNGSASLSYDLTEVDSVSLSVNYALMEYAKREENFADYDMIYVSVSWQHQMLDGIMALVSQASWQHIEFDNPEVFREFDFLGKNTSRTKQDISQDVYSGMLGIYWMPIQKFTMQVMGGANYTSSSIDTEATTTGILWGNTHSSTTQDYNKSGFTGMFDAAWKEDFYSIRLNVKQEFLPSTYGELRKTTSVGLSTLVELDKKSNIYSALNYSHSKSDNITDNKINRDYWRFSIQYLYKFTERFDMRVGYAYQYFDNKSGNIREEYSTRNANSVYLQLTYELPMHF